MPPGSDRFPDGPSGPFAARTERMAVSDVRALFAAARRPDVISLAGGMPFVQALPEADVLDVARAVITERAHLALQYGGGVGLEELREQLVGLMAREGVQSDADRVLVTGGGQQALDIVGKVFIDPGDRIVVEAPSYVGALSAFSVYEPRFETIPLDDDGMVVEALEARFAEGLRPKFVYTVPTFTNPAGVTMSLERRHRLVALCRDAGVPIVEDNPYGMLRFEGDPLPCLHTLDPEGVVYLGTLSKVFAPGMRIGFITAPAAPLERMISTKEASDLCTSSFAQLMAAAYLSGPRFEPNLLALVDVYRERRDAMLAALERFMPEGTTWTRPNGGFYVWVSLPPELDARSLLPTAFGRGVAYVAGTGFYPDGRGSDRIRLAFSYPTPEEIGEGVRRLGAVLSEALTLARGEAAGAPDPAPSHRGAGHGVGVGHGAAAEAAAAMRLLR